MENSVRYASGDWFLVARESGLVLLPASVPMALLDTVWETLDGGGLAQVIDALTEAFGMSLSAIPPFAVATRERNDMRIAVRGGVRVAYDDGQRQDLVTGGRVQTWVEQAIPPYSSLVITPPEARIEEEMLPIASGVVRAGLVTIGSGEVVKPELVDGRRARRHRGDVVGTDRELDECADEEADDEAALAAEAAETEGGAAETEGGAEAGLAAVAELDDFEPAGAEDADAVDATGDADGVRLAAAPEAAPVEERVEEALAEETVVEAEQIVADAEAVDEAEQDAAAVDAQADAEAAAIVDAEESAEVDAEEPAEADAIDTPVVEDEAVADEAVADEAAAEEPAAEEAVAEESAAEEADDSVADDAVAEDAVADDAGADDADAPVSESGSDEADSSADEPSIEVADAAAAEGGDEADDEPGAEAEGLTDDQVDVVFAAITDRELVDASVTTGSTGDHDGHTQEQSSHRAVMGAASEARASHIEIAGEFAGRAVLSTGRVLTLDRVLVVGRRPRVTRTAPNVVPALIAVESPTHDISRNHLEIRREGETVLVTDLDTTNGTVLMRGSDAPRRLHPGEASLVISGDVIDIGDEVTITFEDLP